jgi:hypothetical protein
LDGTALSYGLNGNGFSVWVEWKRLFHLGWIENGFFDWVELGRLFLMGWMRTAFSMTVWFCPRFRAERVLCALPVYHVEDPTVGWVAGLPTHIDRFGSSVISIVHLRQTHYAHILWSYRSPIPPYHIRSSSIR